MKQIFYLDGMVCAQFSISFDFKQYPCTFHLIVKLFVEDMRDPGPSIMKKKPRKKPPLSAPFKSYKIAI